MCPGSTSSRLLGSHPTVMMRLRSNMLRRTVVTTLVLDEYENTHQRMDNQERRSRHRRSGPVFSSSATHSMWCVIGKRSKARSCSRR